MLHLEPASAGLTNKNFEGKRVLDIGCAYGKDFLHPAYEKALSLHGIDPDAVSIICGRVNYPQLDLRIGYAEKLPYEDGYFDFVVSRVSLLYSNIPVAFAEINRVLKPGGTILLTMHDWRITLRFIKKALKERDWRYMVRHAYVMVATVGFVLTGKVLRHPWVRDTQECFQTEGSLRRSFNRAGLEATRFWHEGPHWLIEARKPWPSRVRVRDEEKAWIDSWI
jgi:SAM-dependent methyltransferase